jgi:trehalose 6-phosphate phosphatase
LRALVAETATRTIVYAGDDLGDLAAYGALEAMREAGEADVVLVAIASEEQQALVPRADLVVDGPDELAAWLERLADALGC